MPLRRIDPDPHGTGPGPTLVEMPGKTALLLAELGQSLGAATPGEVVAQALGLLQMLRQAKANGKRVVIRDPGSGHETDLAL